MVKLCTCVISFVLYVLSATPQTDAVKRPSGTHISPPVAQLVHASRFSPSNTGAVTDPWPVSAIVSAIDSLPSSGGIVVIDAGYWDVGRTSITTDLSAKGRVILVGEESQGTDQLLTTITGSQGQHWSVQNAKYLTIENVTFDGSSSSSGRSLLTLTACSYCTVTHNVWKGMKNPSVAVLLVEGGVGNQVTDNAFTTLTGGGQLQINPLAGTPNSGFVVENNTLDSSSILWIGISNSTLSNNVLTNQTLHNYLSIEWTPPCGSSLSNLTISDNILDASSGYGNNAAILGIPEDAGCTGSVSNVTVSSNTVKGLKVIMSIDDLREPTDNISTNISILNNTFTATVGGAQYVIMDAQGYSGSVSNVLILGNTFQSGSGVGGTLETDNRTSNLTVSGNYGI